MNELKDNPLGISWHNSACIPHLNPSNILDYFCDRSNPFYDRTCNNEVVRMQRLGPEQLNNMTGLEYGLLHVQEPILYVVRKQLRQSPTQVIPVTDYYIIAGVVYQAPDLFTVLNSRLLSTISHLQSAFEETIQFSRYHPSSGYWWEFKDKDRAGATAATGGPGAVSTAGAAAADADARKAAKEKRKEEPSSIFQRQRVDMLLVELTKRFAPRIPSQQAAIGGGASAMKTESGATSASAGGAATAANSNGNGGGSNNSSPSTMAVGGGAATGDGGDSLKRPHPSDDDVRLDCKVEIKQEKMDGGGGGVGASHGGSSSLSPMKPPPDKKPRLD